MQVTIILQSVDSHLQRACNSEKSQRTSWTLHIVYWIYKRAECEPTTVWKIKSTKRLIVTHGIAKIHFKKIPHKAHCESQQGFNLKFELKKHLKCVLRVQAITVHLRHVLNISYYIYCLNESCNLSKCDWCQKHELEKKKYISQVLDRSGNNYYTLSRKLVHWKHIFNVEAGVLFYCSPQQPNNPGLWEPAEGSNLPLLKQTTTFWQFNKNRSSC